MHLFSKAYLPYSRGFSDLVGNDHVVYKFHEFVHSFVVSTPPRSTHNKRQILRGENGTQSYFEGGFFQSSL